VLLGNLSDQALLAQYYSMANVTLLTSKRETFSMILAESLCCGTPVVGWKAGGPESIALKEYCHFSEQGDLDGLEQDMQRMLKEDIEKEEVAGRAETVYGAEAMYSGYKNIYDSLLRGEE